MSKSLGSMASTRSTVNGAALLIVLAALVGLCVSLYGYLRPLTGITGSFGALLVSVASAALILDGIFVWFAQRRSARIVWLVLGFLGAICTLVAACFLHSWYLAGAMAFVFLGLLICAASSSHRPASEASA